MPDGYALAFDEARRALDEQERSVVELRGRAATLVSAWGRWSLGLIVPVRHPAMTRKQRD